MRKSRNQIVRVQHVVECDRVNKGDEFLSLLNSDLKKLLKEYFDFSDNVEVSLVKSNNSCVVQLSLKVFRIKNFIKAK